MQTVLIRLFPGSVFSLKITKIIQSPNLTDDISSIEHVTYPANTSHADSSVKIFCTLDS